MNYITICEAIHEWKKCIFRLVLASSFKKKKNDCDKNIIFIIMLKNNTRIKILFPIKQANGGNNSRKNLLFSLTCLALFTIGA